MDYRVHTLEEAKALPTERPPRSAGRKWVSFDTSLGKTRMKIQLDKDAYWYLSIFFFSDSGQFDKYSLDYEDASDSHYEFKDEMAVRRAFDAENEDEKYLDEIMMQFISNISPWQLLEKMMPCITAQFHY